MDKETRLDKLLAWFKNNRFFSIAMLLAIVIVAAGQLVTSIANLVNAGGGLLSKSRQAVRLDEPIAIPSSEPRATVSEPSIAMEVLRFAASGTGPGYLDDPRWIVISPQGQVLISEQTDRGRIQRFALNGEFLTQWFATGRTYGVRSVHSIAFEVQERMLYAIQQWDVYRFEPDAGKDLGELGRQENFNSAAAIVSDPRGGVVALWENDGHGLDLVRYDSGAKSARVIKRDVAKGHFKSKPDSVRAAVDGLGNIYVIGYMEDDAILKFSEDGEFLDRIGKPGDGAGDWHIPLALAVDGAGRLAIVDFDGIHLLDANGHYVGKFNSNCPQSPISADGLAFDIKGLLYVLCQDAVIKYKLGAT